MHDCTGPLTLLAGVHVAAASPNVPLPSFAPLFEDWRMMIPLMLGYFWILVDSRNRGWHDLMSGTVTIQETRPPRFSRKHPPASVGIS